MDERFRVHFAFKAYNFEVGLAILLTVTRDLLYSWQLQKTQGILAAGDPLRKGRGAGEFISMFILYACTCTNERAYARKNN